MRDTQNKAAAKAFSEYWKDKGYEKGESQSFWLSLLRDVLGVEHPEQFVKFEEQVKIDKANGFIDAHIPETKVMIEQKGIDKDLRKGIRQSDGSFLTPFQQARRYIVDLPLSEHPRWVITCNFKEFLIYDMEKPNGEPESILLKDLHKEYYRLMFIVDKGDENIHREMQVSIKAGKIVGVLYDEILKQYHNPENEETLKSLNQLCVRLVFCLYAEDAGIFGSHGKFHNYIKSFSAKDMRKALIELFKILNTKPKDRDPYEDEMLLTFPYVNGGLFADENIEIPQMNDRIRDILLHEASEDFDWSEISPTIFGAVFESTLNPETRRSGGMHYTSIENIHKVINPLFLDELREELEEIKALKVEKTRNSKLAEYQNNLASLTFLDPACGSGNFLTETYISLRRLENDAIATSRNNQIEMDDFSGIIKVSIGQFYGIEINDFAVTVAKTALWIAESQMLKETEEIIGQNLEFLPLKSYANIVEGNALRIDWESVVPKDKLNYIMGNPPFVGYTFQNAAQKRDLNNIGGFSSKKIDYVAGWYYKAINFITETEIKVAFVSTNSITQGEQNSIVWQALFDKGLKIFFAYQSFGWNSESTNTAHVHCVIIGFSFNDVSPKRIFSNGYYKLASQINSYLLDSPNVIISSRTTPLCTNTPIMMKGSQPTDGGHLIIKENELADFLRKEPFAKEYIRKFLGAEEFINNRARYCLWLKNALPSDLRKMPLVIERLRLVADSRRSSSKTATQEWANKPTLFTEDRQPNTNFIVIPEISSEKRKYVPIGFMNPSVICSNKLQIIPNATLYDFGILTSNASMAWLQTVCGRLEMRLIYSNSIVYNNFPWPTPTDEQKAKIEQTAQAILDARALYPDCSLADLYDELTMPVELRRAHQANDKAVMQAYGFWGKINSESECVAELMKMYKKLTEK